MEQDFFTRLPSDITIDILSRLPLPQIGRCRCVSNSWQNLLKSPDFVNTHLSKSVVGLARFCRPSLASIIYEVADDKNCENYQRSNEFVSPAKIEGSVHGLLFHCDGSDSLYLSNPVIRDLIRVPPAPASPQTLSYIFGFGVSITSRQYKIIRISLCLDQPNCDVYTVGALCWRRVRTRVPAYASYKRYSTAFLNGVVHWLVDDDAKRCMHISCFDLETEAFTTFSTPPGQAFDTYFQTLSALEGCLCLCDGRKGGEIVIWLMKEYGNDESWTKELVMKMESGRDFGYYFVPVKVFRNGDLLVVRMREGCGKVLVYSTKTKTFEVKDGLYVNANVVTYTPSFVPVQPYSY